MARMLTCAGDVGGGQCLVGMGLDEGDRPAQGRRVAVVSILGGGFEQCGVRKGRQGGGDQQTSSGGGDQRLGGLVLVNELPYECICPFPGGRGLCGDRRVSGEAHRPGLAMGSGGGDLIQQRRIDDRRRCGDMIEVPAARATRLR